MTLKKFCFCLLCVVFTASVVLAVPPVPNVSPDTASQRLQESISEQQKQKEIADFSKEHEQRKKNLLKEKEMTQEDKVKNISLYRIDFSPSDIFSEDFFDKIKSKYEGTLLSIEDIYSIVSEINNTYLLKGYIAAKAFLPEQDISQGTLFIGLVEGRVREMKIVDAKYTSQNYIKRTIDFRGYETVDVNKMQGSILQFNAANDAKARISLEPGPVYGTTDVNVIMDEPNPLSLAVFMDNAGQTETGLNRYGAYFVVRSLTKYRDILNVGGLISDGEGSHSAFGSYEIPEPFLGTRVGIGGDYSDTEIISGDLTPLDVTGDFYDIYIYSKKPFFVKETSMSNFTFNVATKKGSNYISSFKTQNTKTDTWSVSVDNLQLFNGGYLFSYLSFTNGLTLIDGNAFFTKYAYHGELYKSLFKNTAFNIKVKAQYSDGTTVPSSDQFQIGGVNSIRGYREGMLIADSGVNVMSEFQYDVSKYTFPKIIDYTKLFVFFDYGYIFPGSNANLPDNYRKDIYSTGAGLRTSIMNYLEANLTVGQTLASHSYFEEQDTRFMFFLQGKI